MALIYIVKSFFNSSAIGAPPQAKGKTISGKPHELSPHVFNDIIIVKRQLKQYDNQFYNKLLKLLEKSHSKEIKSLRKKYTRYSTSSTQNHDVAQYQSELFRLYKAHLDDYMNLLHFYKNNYNNSLYHSNKRLLAEIVNKATTQEVEDVDDEYEDAPDHLLDPISFNLFQDPVITPSGITYEKCHLVQHLRQKGNYDPLSRQPLYEHELYPNLIIKEGVENYKLQRIARCEVAK